MTKLEEMREALTAEQKLIFAVLAQTVMANFQPGDVSNRDIIAALEFMLAMTKSVLPMDN